MHPEEEKGGNGTQEELSEREEQERNGREKKEKGKKQRGKKKCHHYGESIVGEDEARIEC